jgi:uncharacterized membrane protein
VAVTKLEFILRNLTHKLWVRAAAFAVLGGLVAVLARFVGPLLPGSWVEKTGADSVSGLLDILATTMLAVTTFSLSIMVQAYGAAASAVTPRAVALLLEDRTSQTVLSTFLGAFLFALVGIIGLQAGTFGDAGRVVLFFATIAVTVAVVIAMIRWISHLTTFGRLGDTTARVEAAALQALDSRVARPCLGAVPLLAQEPPPDHVAVLSQDTGYLCHIDLPRLQEIAQECAIKGREPLLHVACLPGAFVHPQAALLTLPAPVEDALAERLRAAFTIKAQRDFDQDPRFGLCVLSEIAERALSPAVNDPGTAIDVLGRAVRVLARWAPRPEAADPEEVEYPLVAVPPLRLEDLFSDVFPAIARDGAGMLSVQTRLQKSLQALASLSPAVFGNVAGAQSRRALAEARSALIHPEDLDGLTALSADVARLAAAAPCRNLAR